VDYVRLGADGQPVADPFCYRDERNVRAKDQVLSRISGDRLYQLTGVQIITLNTLYQLHADRSAEQSLPWVNLPEFLLHQLGGGASRNTPTPPIPSCWVCKPRPGVPKSLLPLVWTWAGSAVGQTGD
jgi:hypothetical protein